MTDEEQQQQFREHVLAALKKIPGTRPYALDDPALDALADIGICWLENRVEAGDKFNVAEFGKFVNELVDAVEGLRQDWRPGNAPPSPKPWLHPITGAPLPPPQGPDEVGVLRKRNPELLLLWKEMEAAPYRTVAKLQDEELKRARLAAINYDTNEQRNNVWLRGDLQAQGRVTRENPDFAAVCRWEAQRTPIVLPWQIGDQNLTKLAVLSKSAPHLWRLAHKAADRHRDRLEAQKRRAEQERAAAEMKVRAAEKLLGAK